MGKEEFHHKGTKGTQRVTKKTEEYRFLKTLSCFLCVTLCALCAFVVKSYPSLPPQFFRIARKASTAYGNRSGPVMPPVGPPPRRCGSIVAKPLKPIATAPLML